VRVTDISVSRFHAGIKKSSKGEFVVEDNGSKFGTLVMVRKPLLLKKNQKVSLQIGRSMVEFTVAVPTNCLKSLCSLGSKKDNTTEKAARKLFFDGDDVFPEEFLPKNHHEFTMEDEVLHK